MAEKFFGDRVVTMSGMNRRQAPGVCVTAAITAPVSVFGLPAATADAATAPTRSAPLPENGGTSSLPALQRLLNAERAAGMTGTSARVHRGSRTSRLAAGRAGTGTRRPPRTSMRMAAGTQAGAYGLGIKCAPGEHGAMWGHDGYAPGHATFARNSRNSRDGRSVRLFQAENLTRYAGSHGDSVNAIDKARTAFGEAACR